MISRILVPTDLRPADAAGPAARRLWTPLDQRSVVPSDLPPTPLDARTSIPAYLPLEVLATRILVPRDMPATPLDATRLIPEHFPLTVLDSRVAVPKDLPPLEFTVRGPTSPAELPDLLEPDVITTGEVRLLNTPVEERVSNWRWAGRFSSLVFHSLLIALVLLQPKLFPYHPPTREELELARRQLSFIYLPPEVNEVPKIAPNPAERQSTLMRIDPRVLQQIAPPGVEPQPLPGPPQPERVQSDLPAAPTPQLPPGQEQQRREVPRFEPPRAPNSQNALVLPRVSPGKALEESLRGAMEGQGGNSAGFGGPMPPSPSGGGGTGYLGGALQMLTPTEGVDFTNYLTRVLASVKRNWDSVIPESARLGEKGRVVLQFRILKNGSVPYPEPVLVSTSGKEPLDTAARSSIRASTPFEPLPPAFAGPYIELRFIFLYNLPLDYQ